jgi:ACR3 family arsenite efflux pump ArsB
MVHKKFVPKIGKVSLLALLFTIVVMFSLRAQSIVGLPLEVIRISIPLLVYFILMFLLSFYLSIMLRFDYPHAVAQTFTASSNNFELTIAVASDLWRRVRGGLRRRVRSAGGGAGAHLAGEPGVLVRAEVL